MKSVADKFLNLDVKTKYLNDKEKNLLATKKRVNTEYLAHLKKILNSTLDNLR